MPPVILPSLVDLHAHTSASDGLLRPAEVVSFARELNVTVLGITDHDTIAGLPEALEASLEAGILLVPGVEVSASWAGREVHLLGYGVCPSDRQLEARLAPIREARLRRASEIVRRLRGLGLEISMEDVLRQCPSRNAVGRPHIARALLEKGLVRSRQEAFSRYLGRGRPAFVEKELMPFSEAVEAILDAGAIPVLAHPSSSLRMPPDSLLEAVRNMVAEGLRGVEAWYPGAGWEDYHVGKELGLLMTGGTDFHGPPYNLGWIHIPERAVRRFLRTLAPRLRELGVRVAPSV